MSDFYWLRSTENEKARLLLLNKIQRDIRGPISVYSRRLLILKLMRENTQCFIENFENYFLGYK